MEGETGASDDARKGRRLSADEHEKLAKEIVRAYRAHRSIRQIAVSVDRSYWFVRVTLLACGVELRERGGGYRKTMPRAARR